MNKRILSLFMALLIAISVFSLPVFAENTPVIKNIIYLIPDGGGYALYDFANMVKEAGGFDETLFPTKTPTTTDPMTMRSYLAGSMTTAPITGGVTDSAAAGTAMATGYKTIKGYMGIDSDCVPKANLVEAAKSKGMATGLVATYEWMHATPGSFSAHALYRTDYADLYRQIETKGIEVVLAAGYGAVAEYATIQNAIDAGYNIIETKDDVAAVEPGDILWGNVADTNLPYDVYLAEDQPNLSELTEAAITALSGDPDGFFLMVEGSKVDSGGHSNDPRVTTSEYLAFDAAFRVAIDFAMSRTDTVVICAPDHDTGGMILPEDPESAISLVINGDDASKEAISWTTTSHTDQNVGVWVYVPEGIDLPEGLNPEVGDTEETRENYVIDNTDLAPWCAELMGVDLDALSEELFVDVSRIGEYHPYTGKFTFNSGNKYVFKNEAWYFENDEKINTPGKNALYINGKFYVPSEMVTEEDWEYESAEGEISGSGTASDPYILDDAYDFITFTNNLSDGNTYSGEYIRQTKNINLAAFSEYQGIGSNYTFAGTYDGGGNTLTVAITSDSNVSVFPRISGVIMNLGTEGTVVSNKDGGFAAGVAYYVEAGGKIVNCYSNAKIKAAYTGGITTYNEGFVGNCSFCGELYSSKNRAVPIGITQGNSSRFWECYYLDGSGNHALEVATAISSSEAKTELADILNDNRSDAGDELDYSEKLISYWTNDYGYPVLYNPIPVVERITITPHNPTVNKGGSLALSAEVTGQYNYSEEVSWSIEGNVAEGTTIDDDGYLVIDENELLKTFLVMAKSKQDGGVAGVITVTVADPEIEITVSATSSTGGTVYFDNDPVDEYLTVTQGEEVTLEAVPEDGARFKAWINAATGKIISTNAEYTFTAYTDRKIYALFADADTSDTVFVSFISKNNQFLYYNYLTKGTDVSTFAPSPEKMYVSGYLWNSFIPALSILSQSTDYKGDYTKDSVVYEINILGGTDNNGDTEIALEYNASCTVIADDPDAGETFTGWLINDTLVSLNPEFTFRVFGDMTLEATYGSSPDDIPFVVLPDITKWTNGKYNMISLIGTNYLPEDYTFIEAGFLYVKAEADESDLVLENEGEMISKKEIKRTSVTRNQMFKLSADYTGSGITARGYLVYLDPSGNKHVIYTDINYVSTEE